MRKFPKTITIQARHSDRFFYGKPSFYDKVFTLLLKALKSEDLTDLIVEKIGLSKHSVHYGHYHINAHLSTLSFTSKFLEGTIEVKHYGKNWEGGQIEQLVITITKCEVPKVVFT